MRGGIVSDPVKKARIRKSALLIPVTPHFEAETGLYMTAHTTISFPIPAGADWRLRGLRSNGTPDLILGAADPNNPPPPAGPDDCAAPLFRGHNAVLIRPCYNFNHL
jgi:hypothetical protein